MTSQPPKPSYHDIITGKWTPTPGDIQKGRVPGFGATVNVINGGVECGSGTDIPKQNTVISISNISAITSTYRRV